MGSKVEISAGSPWVRGAWFSEADWKLQDVRDARNV
jgi:hypothetical protein